MDDGEHKTEFSTVDRIIFGIIALAMLVSAVVAVIGVVLGPGAHP